MNTGKRLERIPTESFFPKVKYARSRRLPLTLMYQNTRGTVGRPRRRDAYTWTSHRPANSATPRYPTSFQGVSVTPR